MWVAHRGGAADEPPTPEQIQQWKRRMSPPENEFPGGVGITVLLGRSADAAVGITEVEAFSNGFQFAMTARVREARREFRHGRLFMLVSSHAEPGVEIPLEDRLLLGLEYPNGLRASTLRDMRMMLRPGVDPGDEHLVLVQHGADGGELRVDQRWWVSPLPPEGPLTFVVAWPSFGIPESRTVVDSAPIRAAAERSQHLWPPQPPIEPSEPPTPPLPSSGWFAEPSD